MDDAVIWLSNSWLAAKHFLVTVFGAFVLYMLHRHNNHEPFSLFRAINIELTKPFPIFIDMMVSSLIGAVIVHILSTPSTTADALTGGLGFTGLLSSFGRRGES